MESGQKTVEGDSLSAIDNAVQQWRRTVHSTGGKVFATHTDWKIIPRVNFNVFLNGALALAQQIFNLFKGKKIESLNVEGTLLEFQNYHKATVFYLNKTDKEAEEARMARSYGRKQTTGPKVPSDWVEIGAAWMNKNDPELLNILRKGEKQSQPFEKHRLRMHQEHNHLYFLNGVTGTMTFFVKNPFYKAGGKWPLYKVYTPKEQAEGGQNAF